MQARIRGIFRTFARHGSLSATLRALAADGQGLPVRRAQGPLRGELAWPPPSTATLYQLLTSPVYAGAFAWGRVAGADAGDAIEGRWRHLLKDRHPAYIPWDVFVFNQRQLAQNRWPVRGLGGGLLSGLVRCGRCGQGMTVSYRDGGGDGLRYTCRGRRDYGGAICQSLSSPPLERWVAAAAVQALAPASVELSLQALQQAEADRTEEHAAWRLRLARAEQDVAAAQRAWRAVDPANRLVGQTLEDAWETALAEQERLREAYRRFGQRTPATLSAREQAAIREATSGIAELWQDGRLTKAEQVELLRLMIERVTVTVMGDSERVEIEVHWYGGVRTRAELRRPVRSLEQLSYYEDLQAQVGTWRAAGRSSRTIAELLNASDWKPARHDVFTEASVTAMIQRMGMGTIPPTRLPRPPPAGQGGDEWLIADLAAATGVTVSTLHGWIRKRRLHARKEPPTADGKRQRWLIRADPATCNAIRTWRARPRAVKSYQRIPDFRNLPAAGRS